MTFEEIMITLALVYIAINEVRYIFLMHQMDKNINLVYKTLDVADKFSKAYEPFVAYEPVYYDEKEEDYDKCTN